MPGTSRSRTLLVALAAAATLAVAAVACAPADEPPNVPIATQGRFAVSVVDNLNDAGRGASVALTPDGTVSVSYLLFKAVLKPGDIAPLVVPGQPQPPAVVLGTSAKGVWSRASVTPQKTSPVGGDAPQIANKNGEGAYHVKTALAVNDEGKHFVAWSSDKADGGVFYDDDTAGAPGQPQQVVSAPAAGASIALAEDGTVWIAYYSDGGLSVATGTGQSWKTETVDPNVGLPQDAATVTGIGVGPDGEPVVAYGANGATFVATRKGGQWSPRQVAGDGGIGVSLAMDKDGNPHVAYYDGDGGVHHAHSVGGGPWEVTDLATTTAAANRPELLARYGTGIAVDDNGTHYIAWADPQRDAIELSTNQSGDFTTSELPTSAGGGSPSVAVTPDGKALAVAWYDADNGNLDVAETGGGLTLAFSPPPAATPTAGTGGGVAPKCQPSGDSLQITAQNIAFDTDCLAAPADTPFTIDFTNNDAGVPHNVDIYSAAGGDHLGGAAGPADILTGPGSTTYKVDALKAGVYYFQCDIHPNMNGQFVVAK